MNPLLYFSALVAWTVVLEFVILRRWFGRRSLAALVFIGAFVSGVLWASLWALFSWGIDAILHPGPATQFVGSGVSWEIAIYLMAIWLLCGVALVPSTLTAIIYRRFWSKT